MITMSYFHISLRHHIYTLNSIFSLRHRERAHDAANRRKEGNHIYKVDYITLIVFRCVDWAMPIISIIAENVGLTYGKEIKNSLAYILG